MTLSMLAQMLVQRGTVYETDVRETELETIRKSEGNRSKHSPASPLPRAHPPQESQLKSPD